MFYGWKVNRNISESFPVTVCRVRGVESSTFDTRVVIRWLRGPVLHSKHRIVSSQRLWCYRCRTLRNTKLMTDHEERRWLNLARDHVPWRVLILAESKHLVKVSESYITTTHICKFVGTYIDVWDTPCRGAATICLTYLFSQTHGF